MRDIKYTAILVFGILSFALFVWIAKDKDQKLKIPTKAFFEIKKSPDRKIKNIESRRSTTVRRKAKDPFREKTDDIKGKPERRGKKIQRPRGLDYFGRDGFGRLPSPKKILSHPWFARFRSNQPLYKNKELCARISRLVVEARAEWVKEQKKYAVRVSKAVDFLKSHGLPITVPKTYKGNVATGSDETGRFRIPETWFPEAFEPLVKAKMITETLTLKIECAIRNFLLEHPELCRTWRKK